MQQRGHIRIFMLYDAVPRNWQRAFDVVSTLLLCLFSAAVVWGGFNEARDKLLRWETFGTARSEEHTSELQSLMRISYAVFCLKKKKTIHIHHQTDTRIKHIYT